MKLIIDIPDEQYEYINLSDKNTFADVSSKECMLYAIKNGTPVSTGGDLISRSELKKAFNKWWGCDDIPTTIVEDLIDSAPTIEIPNYGGQVVPDTLQGWRYEKRQQGKWILKETDCDDGSNSDVHASSAEVPFCWHCGSGMKGGAE